MSSHMPSSIPSFTPLSTHMCLLFISSQSQEPFDPPTVELKHKQPSRSTSNPNPPIINGRSMRRTPIAKTPPNWSKLDAGKQLQHQFSVPGVSKLGRLQPYQPILYWKFSNFFTFILGGQFLLPQRANKRRRGVHPT